MPASDILNPVAATWDSTIQDSMNPNYGWTRKRAGTQLHTKAVGGKPWTRETQNTGHVFNFSWLQRSWLCAQRLKWYFEQYEDGYFTMVDHDGGGRQYVGRFTTEVIPVETGNGRYDVQNVTFEEMPQVAMLEYPSDWDHDSIFMGVLNDDGDRKLAVQGAWTQSALMAAPEIELGGFMRTNLPLDIMTNAGTSAGDWATYQYRGYGFQLWLAKGPGYGKCQVFLDGVSLGTVDCYAATSLGPVSVLTETGAMLDIHDAQVTALHTKNASSSGYEIDWYGMQVMR